LGIGIHGRQETLEVSLEIAVSRVVTVKISTVLIMPSVRRLAINIVTMLLVFLITKGESVSINSVCKKEEYSSYSIFPILHI
jgi:hypothetical protein